MFNPDLLVADLFSGSWADLHQLTWDDDQHLKYPGVYLLAYTEKSLAGRKVHVDNVYYVGMSNSAGAFGHA